MRRPLGKTARREVSVAVRKNLIDQLSHKGISDERVLDAMTQVPRELFAEEGFVNLIYQDRALPIGHGQTISQPYVVAYMTQTLLAGEELNSVLEIGTGSGYQTAVLANLIARVFTIERIAPLYKGAKRLLNSLGYRNVNFRCGDGHKGWQTFAPYDAIIVTAAASEPPPMLLKQLSIGRRMVVPIGETNRTQKMMCITRHKNGYSEEYLMAVKFVPLVEGTP